MVNSVQHIFAEFLRQFDPVTKDGQPIQDDAASFEIVGATDNGDGLIRIEAPGHGLRNRQRVYISGMADDGTIEANNTLSNPSWEVRYVDPSNFDLSGSTFINVYTTGGTGIGALAGSVNGAKLRKGRQLDCYNKARIAFLEGARVATKGTEELCKKIGAHTVVEALVFDEDGYQIVKAPVPPGQVKLVGIRSPIDTPILLLPETRKQSVLNEDYYYKQSTEKMFVFQEGAYYVHHGTFISGRLIPVTDTYNDDLIRVVFSAPEDTTKLGLGSHGFIRIANVLGTVEANGDWKTIIDNPYDVTLMNSAFVNTYDSGGTARALCTISYLGITDWTLQDVLDGTKVETIEPADVPILLELAVAIAKGFGGAQANSLAAKLIGGGK